MIDLFLAVVDSVWHFIFYMGEYVNHTFGKILVGFVLLAILSPFVVFVFYHLLFLSGYMLWVKLTMERKYREAGYPKWSIISDKYKQMYPRTFPFMFCLRQFTHWTGSDLISCDRLTTSDGVVIQCGGRWIPKTSFPIVTKYRKEE